MDLTHDLVGKEIQSFETVGLRDTISAILTLTDTTRLHVSAQGKATLMVGLLPADNPGEYRIFTAAMLPQVVGQTITAVERRAKGLALEITLTGGFTLFLGTEGQIGDSPFASKNDFYVLSVAVERPITVRGGSV